jgi:hypothetical protein
VNDAFVVESRFLIPIAASVQARHWVRLFIYNARRLFPCPIPAGAIVRLPSKEPARARRLHPNGSGFPTSGRNRFILAKVFSRPG